MILDFNKKSISPSEYILSKISDYQIYRFYLEKDFILGETFKSPFREDKNPSFNIFSNNDGKLIFKDRGRSSYFGDCFKFVSTLFNINYIESCIKIYNDIILNTELEKDLVINRPIISLESKYITIKQQPFTFRDYVYWLSFGIEINTLLKYEVSSCRCVYVDHQLRCEYKKDNPIYSYKLDSGFKIYKPLEKNKKYKWISSINKGDYQGFKQLKDKGELLIITKSLKDVMVLDTLGFNSIAPHTENINIEEKIINDLNNRFDNIIILYDNDVAGKQYSEKICTKYGLSSIYIPENSNKKDISEYRQEFGRIETGKLLNKLIYGK